MPELRFTASDGSQRSVQVTVQASSQPLPAGFQTPAPPITTRTVTGQTVSSLQNGTRYVNCTVTASMWLTGTNAAPVQDLDFQGCTFSGTFGPKGAVRRLRINGGEFGHVHVDGTTVTGGQSQIKPNPVTGTDPVPSDIELANVRFTDNQRTTTGIHIEGLQLGGVQRLWVHDCSFDRNSVFDMFMRSWIGVAGIDTAPIEDILVEGCTMQAPTNFVDSGTGSATLSASDYSDSNARLNQMRRLCFRNNRCGLSITVQPPDLETEGSMFYGNTRLDGTPMTRTTGGSPPVLKFS